MFEVVRQAVPVGLVVARRRPAAPVSGSSRGMRARTPSSERSGRVAWPAPRRTSRWAAGSGRGPRATAPGSSARSSGAVRAGVWPRRRASAAASSSSCAVGGGAVVLEQLVRAGQGLGEPEPVRVGGRDRQPGIGLASSRAAVRSAAVVRVRGHVVPAHPRRRLGEQLPGVGPRLVARVGGGRGVCPATACRPAPPARSRRCIGPRSTCADSPCPFGPRKPCSSLSHTTTGRSSSPDSGSPRAAAASSGPDHRPARAQRVHRLQQRAGLARRRGPPHHDQRLQLTGCGRRDVAAQRRRRGRAARTRGGVRSPPARGSRIGMAAADRGVHRRLAPAVNSAIGHTTALRRPRPRRPAHVGRVHPARQGPPVQLRAPVPVRIGGAQCGQQQPQGLGVGRPRRAW